MIGERKWNKHKAKYKGHDYSSAGLKTGQEYQIAYRITPDNCIEWAVNLEGVPNRIYKNQKDIAKQWQIVE